MEPRNTPPERLSVLALVKNFVSDLANADRGLLGTIVKLLWRPERVIDTYLYEDRNHYLRPTRYVLFALSVAAVLYITVQLRFGEPLHEYLRPYYQDYIEDSNTELLLPYQDADGRILPGVAELDYKMARKQADLNEAYMLRFTTFLTQYSNYLSLLFIPLQALIFWLAFPRRGYNFAESLAANTYIGGTFLLLTLISLPFILAINSPHALAEVLNIVGLVQILYLLYATYRVYALGVRAGLRGFAIALGISLVLFSLGTLVIYYFGYYNGLTDGGERTAGLPFWTKVGFTFLAYLALFIGFLRWRFRGRCKTLILGGITFVTLLGLVQLI